MPGVVDKRLPVLPGTLAIAEKIGATNILTTGSLPADNEGDESLRIIIPFFSDILWAIREPDGSVNKCINWNIKDEQEAFSLPAPQRRRGKASAESDRDRTVARHTLERLYYEEAGIRTVQIGLDQLDETFRENLRRLFGQHRRRITLDEQLQRALKEHFATALQAGVPPFEVILDLKRRHQFDIHDARTLLWQLIWRRELRVDLFSTLLIDRPLKPESIDPLEKYADWFRG